MSSSISFLILNFLDVMTYIYRTNQLVKKQKIYERGKELLETIATNTPPPPPSAMEEEEEERKKRNPFAKANADQYLTEDSDDGMRVKHAPCCFCGCREKEGSSGPPL